MRLAVASGKGGTGKTTVAVSLARVAAEDSPARVRLLDCDVEGPNAEIFLSPVLTKTRQAGLLVPHVDASLCDLCGRCAEVCAFGAISVLKDRVLVFPELCAGCGSCTTHCPPKAIREELIPLGDLSAGSAGALEFAQGKLRAGQGRATTVIRELKAWRGCTGEEELCIVDAPPGAACSMLEAVRGADYVILVTEPTPFGLHDLAQAAAAVREGLLLPCGVIINRSRGRDNEVEQFCREQGIEILLRIPFRRRIAVAGAEGRSIEEVYPEIRPAWRELLARLSAELSEQSGKGVA